MAEVRLAKHCEFEPRCFSLALLGRRAMEGMPDTTEDLLDLTRQPADANLNRVLEALEVVGSTPLPDPPLCRIDCPRLIGPTIP